MEFEGPVINVRPRYFSAHKKAVTEVGFDGPVEEVGFRSTRIRTLDGHVVSVPNSKIANEMVENIGKRPFIKRVANIGITYDTPIE